MKRAVLVLLALVLVACAPKLEPTLPPATGVTTTATVVDAGTLFRVDVDLALDRLVLLSVGEGLAVNASECTGTPTEVSCVVRDIATFYELTIAGGIRFVQAVAQRGSDYSVVEFPLVACEDEEFLLVECPPPTP